MKKTGVVIDYDGYTGIIETETKERYFLIREEIVNEVELHKLDNVMFVPEEKKYEDAEYCVARFVRKLGTKSSSSGYSRFHPIE